MSVHDLINIVWVSACTILVFFMQAGFAMVECGSSRAKNAVNVIMKNYTDMCIGAFAFWLLGYGLMFGSSAGGWLGLDHFALSEFTPQSAVAVCYQIMFASTAATIISGAVAERMHYNAYLAGSALVTGLIYPVYGHWAWHADGWLRQLGFIDFAGSTVVHSIGAWCALAAVLLLGPRLGRFGKQGETRDIPGHNLPMLALGGFILWMGWFGFNGGSVSGVESANIGLVLINTHLGGAAGALGAMLLMAVTRRPILMSATVNASLAGLVSITAGAATMTPALASLTGLVGGMLFLFGSDLLHRLRVDDTVDAIAVHGLGGVWGTLAAGLFFAGDLFNPARVGIQLLGIVAALLWALPLAGLCYVLIDKFIGLRASTLHEQRGLDYTEHSELGYPEFQESPAQLKMEG